jgi:hypothetical protein
LLEHAICILEDVVIPETQNAETAASQVGIAYLVACAIDVLTTVCFNDEHLFE